MKILLLGGTGAIGIALVKILAKNKHEIYVTSRDERISKDDIHYIKGNAHEYEFVKNILNKNRFDVIVDFMVYTNQEFEKRVELYLVSTNQYVFLSSSRVYANNDMEKITEESPRLLDVIDDKEYLLTGEYALEKAREENVLYYSARKNWTIVRPYITYNRERLQLGMYEKEDWLYRVMNGKSIVFSYDMLDKYTTLTYGYDVAYGISELLGKKSTYSQVYHITTEKAYTWREILDVYKEVLEEKGYTVELITIDKAIDAVPTLKYQIVYDRLYNRRFNCGKINNFVDTRSFKDTKEGLRECITTFIEIPKWKKINWSTHARLDRISKEYTKLREISSNKDKIKYILFRYVVSYEKYRYIISRLHKLKDLFSSR